MKKVSRNSRKGQKRLLLTEVAIVGHLKKKIILHALPIKQEIKLFYFGVLQQSFGHVQIKNKASSYSSPLGMCR